MPLRSASDRSDGHPDPPHARLPLAPLLALGLPAAAGYALARLEDRRRERARTRDLESAVEALRYAEATFRGLLEGAPDAMLLVDREGKIVLVNAQAEALFGYSRDELLDRPVEMLVSPRDRERPEGLRRCLDAVPSQTCSIELEAVRRDGTEFPAEVRTSAFETPRGVFVFGAVRDATERKRAATELERRAAALARSNAELQQFAYVASHDLQEPLRMIAGFTELLRQRYHGRLDSDADEYIGFAIDGATRIQRLIRDLLAYSRIETRGRELADVDAAGVLEQAISQLEPALKETGAVVRVLGAPRVLGDEPQLRQLFAQLLGNALKFRSEATPEVEVEGRVEGDECVFRVADNGIGIEPSHHERIFAIFQRLHARDRYPGTGAGLAICKKIVERHGGRIWVESEPGRGSTFWFTLRAAPAPAAPAAPRAVAH